MTDADETGIADPEASADAAESTTRRRIVRGYIGGAALLVVAALLAWWALANASTDPAPSTSPDSSVSGSPTASASPAASTSSASTPAASATDDESPDAAPQPLAPRAVAPVIEAFSSVASQVVCPADRSSEVPIDFTWRTVGADQVWIAVGTTDASALPFAEVPPNADSYVDLTFTCREEEQLYTLTARGAGGTTSSSVTVTRSEQ